jgi:hypothetical protein
MASPDGFAGPPSIALTGRGLLMAAWSDTYSGKIYFSQAAENEIMNATNWIPPAELPVPINAARSPILLVSPDETIYAAYILPLNEQRGFYLTQSTDGGKSWSSPTQIFDAASAEWEMVEQPQLSLAPDGILHALWMRSSLPGGQGSLGLYYARSSDSGLTWRPAEAVSEMPVSWGKIASGRGSEVHRLWLEKNGSFNQVQHQYSTDGGITWSRAVSAGSYFSQPGFNSLAHDLTGSLHLLQAIQDYTGQTKLQHWIWNGESWATSVGQTLFTATGIQMKSLSALLSPSGLLPVVYTSSQYSTKTGSMTENLIFTSRLVEIPETSLAPLPTSLLLPTAVPEPTSSLNVITPTPTVNVAALPVLGPQDAEPLPTQNKYSSLILGAGLTTVLVGVIFGVGLVTIKRKNRF